LPEDLLSNKYGHSIHFWDLRARKNIQTMDFGDQPSDGAGNPPRA
jgi:selenium-binding protein 1